MSRASDDGFRNSLACQSCRQRKRRCDRQLPRCGLCVRRGVECVMTTARNEGQEGLVESLERELARLEAHLSDTRASGASGELQDSDPISKGQNRDSPDGILGPLPRQSSPQTVDLNVLKEVETVSLYRGELYGLEEMTHRALRLDNSDPRGFFNNGPRKSLIASSSRRSRDSAQNANEPSLDRETASRYADHFFSHIHPTFPVLREARIRHAIDMLLEEGQVPGAEEQIMTFLVLAMGAILPSQSSVLDTVNSARFFLSAAEVQFSYDESFKTAQILLLFNLYSLFDPTTGSSWQLIDLVMQVCIVLGLHQLHAEDGVAEEAEGVKLFQAAYTLDFFISTSLGLPMSTRNADITIKHRVRPLADSPSCDILSPEGIYCWAHELCDSPDHTASDFLRAYDQHILHDGGARDDLIRRSIPSILGWHLAIQSLRRMAPGDVTNASRDGQLIDHWQAIPKTMPALLMMPWIAGYAAFQAILLQIIICGRAPDTRSRLTRSLSHSNLILSALSSKFEGLKPHAEFGSSIGERLVRDSLGGTMHIDFLEGSDLHDFCREALQRLGMGVE